MSLRIKIIIGLILTLIALIVIPAGITNYLINKNQFNQPTNTFEYATPTQPDELTQYKLDEGYTFELPEGWKLESHTPDRSVDRYRFIKTQDNAIFTISFYDRLSSFEEVIETRYGGAYLSGTEDTTINDFSAKRLSSAFTDPESPTENEKTSVDIIIKINENTFVSLYGLHYPEGESSSLTTQEIDYMQQSFLPNVNR